MLRLQHLTLALPIPNSLVEALKACLLPFIASRGAAQVRAQYSGYYCLQSIANTTVLIDNPIVLVDKDEEANSEGHEFSPDVPDGETLLAPPCATIDDCITHLFHNMVQPSSRIYFA